MPAEWETTLARWTEAGLVEPAAAQRIRAYEAEHGPSQRFRWPTLIALAFGALMLGAGLLLFVSAHWDTMSPGARFALVLFVVGLLHVGGAVAGERSHGLAVALHAVGTVALGAGIALAGQIFNLAVHWPRGAMLWALGASLGWLLLRDWTQATLAALLVPAWLASEWIVATGDVFFVRARPLASGVLLLAVAYLGARSREHDGAARRALGWVGAILVIPCTLGVIFTSALTWPVSPPLAAAPAVGRIGWTLAIGLPLGLAVALRGTAAWANVVAIGWVLVLGSLRSESLLYLWCAAGAIGLTAWGMAERRSERINLGVAGFAMTVLAFSYSNLMDKLGRSASLVGLGIAFLAGGWVLERLRRQLVARATAGLA